MANSIWQQRFAKSVWNSAGKKSHLPLWDVWRSRLARVEHLLAMKLLSRDPSTRQQDDLDVAALLQGLSVIEADKVADALRLITKRGFHRRRRLVATWNRLRPR